MENYQRLKDLREDEDMKQWQIAEILGMKQEQYQRYESGKRETPINILIKLANYYDISLDYIAGRTNDKGGLHSMQIDQDEKKLLALFRRLNRQQKNIILELLYILDQKTN